MRKKILAGMAVLALGLGATGCSSLTEEFNDAPIGKKYDGPAEVYSMPDGFANFASKCDAHGNRVYTTRGGNAGKAIAVVAADPSCKAS